VAQRACITLEAEVEPTMIVLGTTYNLRLERQLYTRPQVLTASILSILLMVCRNTQDSDSDSLIQSFSELIRPRI
jgi:hypothetical protein